MLKSRWLLLSEMKISMELIVVLYAINVASGSGEQLVNLGGSRNVESQAKVLTGEHGAHWWEEGCGWNTAVRTDMRTPTQHGNPSHFGLFSSIDHFSFDNAAGIPI